MNETPAPLAASAAESAARIKQQRAEQQRKQRVLQLEEQIADGKARLERCRAAQRDAQRRLEAASERVAECDGSVVALETELARLESQAPEQPPIDAEFEDVTADVEVPQ